VVKSGELALAVFESGDHQNETVILLHGWPDTHLLWRDVVPLLSSRYHVVTYDQRGHGLSTSPKRWQDFAFDQLAQDIRAVTDAVCPGKRVHLLGHDFGAIYAWEAVCDDDAERRFASFTCVSGFNIDHAGVWMRKALRHPTPRNVAGLVGQLLCSSYILGLFVPGVPARLFKYLGQHAVWMRMLRVLSGVPHHNAYLANTLPRDMLSGMRIYRANIGKLAHPRDRRTLVPVQMITSKYDVAVRRIPLDDAPLWAQELSFHEIRAGHWSPFTHPREIADLTIAFVDAHPIQRDNVRADRSSKTRC
jgi:pimeloyl-ACP methyl ester carboxylesterase